MQVKKDEVRLSLLQEGEIEFLAKGFRGASLRKITKAAGTTLGNFYNYFDSKEDLFDQLVREDYYDFMNFMSNHQQSHHDQESNDVLHDSSLKEIRSIINVNLENILPKFTNGFILLMESSEGTPYEQAKVQIIEAIKENFKEHLSAGNRWDLPESFSNIIAQQFVDGVLQILKSDEESETIKKLLEEQILFYIFGTMGITENNGPGPL